MSYIGRDLNIGDRRILSVSGSTPATSYTLQHNSANYDPSAAQNLMVSINGVIQEPVTAYTVSGSTIDFNGVSVASSDIDFIIAMGDITITSGRNVLVAGPITVTGTLTIPASSTMVII